MLSKLVRIWSFRALSMFLCRPNREVSLSNFNWMVDFLIPVEPEGYYGAAPGFAGGLKAVV